MYHTILPYHHNSRNVVLIPRPVQAEDKYKCQTRAIPVPVAPDTKPATKTTRDAVAKHFMMQSKNGEPQWWWEQHFLLFKLWLVCSKTFLFMQHECVCLINCFQSMHGQMQHFHHFWKMKWNWWLHFGAIDRLSRSHHVKMSNCHGSLITLIFVCKTKQLNKVTKMQNEFSTFSFIIKSNICLEKNNISVLFNKIFFVLNIIYNCLLSYKKLTKWKL